MANKLFPHFYHKMLTGVAGMHLGGDLRLLLAMEDETITADDMDDVEFLDDFTDLDEMNGAGYSRLALSTATPSVTKDDAANVIKLECTNHPVFSSLTAGTRAVKGVLMYVNVLGDDAQSVPVLWMPYTTPRNPDGGDFTIELPADKVILRYGAVAVGTSFITDD